MSLTWCRPWSENKMGHYDKLSVTSVKRVTHNITAPVIRDSCVALDPKKLWSRVSERSSPDSGLNLASPPQSAARTPPPSPTPLLLLYLRPPSLPSTTTTRRRLNPISSQPAQGSRRSAWPSIDLVWCCLGLVNALPDARSGKLVARPGEDPGRRRIWVEAWGLPPPS